ncbi:TPA: hypothetical protein ACOEP1_004986 [Enterobacter kobei]
MSASNMEQLEGIISSSTNKEYPNTPPTEAQFSDIAAKLRKLMAPLYPVSDDEFDKLRRRLALLNKSDFG